jgi:hypothetical protein
MIGNCIVHVMCAGVNAFLHMEDGMLGYQWARAIAAMVSRDTGQQACDRVPAGTLSVSVCAASCRALLQHVPAGTPHGVWGSEQ